jgi:hypothetical protein
MRNELLMICKAPVRWKEHLVDFFKFMYGKLYRILLLLLRFVRFEQLQHVRHKKANV